MRIWVTGIGVVSPLAPTATRTMDRLVAGDRALGPLSLFELGDCRARFAAEVSDLDVAAVAGAQASQWSRTDAMAVIAAREALAQAGLDPSAQTVDLVLGGTTAGMFETEGFLAEMARDAKALAPRQQMLSHPLSATVDRMQVAVAPFRRARTICSACSSGANALLIGASWILSGAAERVVAGGADGLCRLTYAGFAALGAMSPELCRPFDASRSGLNLGEAAAFLVLESERAARARGAEPICELRGWAMGSEAHHITHPEPSGATAAQVMQRALERAGITPREVDYVNAHGTATRHNDPMETQAIGRSLGDETSRVWVSSSKGQIGHTLGAAGAIEAAITALAIQRQLVPPTMGLDEVDPDCQLRHVRHCEAVPLRAAMSNSFGFGGADTVLVLARPGFFEPLASVERRRVFVTGAATVGPLGVHPAQEAREYLAEGSAPAVGAIIFEPSDHLDLERARRIDRPGRMSTVAIDVALRAAATGAAGPAPEATGAILGSAYGSVDDSAAYVDRIYRKGMRFAKPAVFPNLTPSSAVAHASIYLGLRGPVFATCDLGATAEAAMLSAAELVAAGEGDCIVAGSVEIGSQIIERVLAPVCTGARPRGVRSEGAAVAVFEAAAELARRADGAKARPWLAELTWMRSWRGPPVGALQGLPPPPEGARAVVLVGEDDDAAHQALDGAVWASVARQATAPRAGHHEGAGGFAVVAAVGTLAADQADAALVLGLAPDRGYALLLQRAQPPAPGTT